SAPHTAGASTAGFAVLLTAGLLTGLSHCAGMCGPLVGSFALRRRAAGQEVATPLVLFQLGRLTTYTLLGLLFGTIGAALAGMVHTWQSIFSVILGVITLLMGLSLLGLFPLQHHLASLTLSRAVVRQMKRLTGSDRPTAAYGLGLANGLLPCGPIYAIGLLAATAGNPLKGAEVMLIFGLGTLPAMFGIGLTASQVSLKLRRHLYRLAAGLVVLVGLQMALRGLAAGGQLTHASLGGVMLW
ncbi:MAG: sulfite exporter TauE/SafE family protein, partial [Chloroflexi bacterium]